MGRRYASHSQEVLYRDGKLIGFNAGYGSYAEHIGEYGGDEQRKRENTTVSDKDNPFDGDIIANPREVKMMEFSDGNVWITSDSWKHIRLMTQTEQERQEIMLEYINNSDRKVTEDFLTGLGKNIDSPNVVALWDGGFQGRGGSFDLISTNGQSSELLRKLYTELQKGNVAVSSDYSFMFEDRGLSFVLLDQLSKEDLAQKQLIDYRAELAEQFMREYREYLSQQGLEEFRSQYPIEFCRS